MFRRVTLGVAALAIAGIVCASLVAADEQKPAEVTITGKVVGINPERTPPPQDSAACKLAAGSTVYFVFSDDTGKKLANEATGKTVEVKGTVEVKAKLSWLTVKEYKVLPEGTK